MSLLPSSTQATHTEAGTWASRLAQCRNRDTAEPVVAHSDELLDEINALWKMFDDARTEANTALLVERISVHHTGVERRYGLLDADGAERTISISVALRDVDGHDSGGAFIGLGGSRLAIYLVPETRGEQVHWLAMDGTEFTLDLVHDLFLSVFGDDSAATFRLSPMAGSDLFQTPWS